MMTTLKTMMIKIRQDRQGGVSKHKSARRKVLVCWTGRKRIESY